MSEFQTAAPRGRGFRVFGAVAAQCRLPGRRIVGGASAARRSQGRQIVVSCLLAGVLSALCLGGLTACVPLVAAGAGVAGISAFDRRSLGAQTEDQSIELRASSRLSEVLAKTHSVSVTSFNRKVLLSGFVSDEKQKELAEATVSKVVNVRSVHNEVQIGFRPSFATSTSDATVTTRVKASLLDARDLQSGAFKVVTESGTVYLMGLVTQREGDRAAQVASLVGGVQRVVTVFEYLTENELINLGKSTSSTTAPVAK